MKNYQIGEIDWLDDRFIISYNDYSMMKFHLYHHVKKFNCSLYWIEDLDFPGDISKGYVGVTNGSIFTRFDKAHQYKLNIKESINKYGIDNVKPICLATGHYQDILQCERYFRPQCDIGWNKARGGNSIAWGNHQQMILTQKQNNIRNRELGLPTSGDIAAISRKITNQKLKSSGLPTIHQKISKTIKENNIRNRELGLPTSGDKKNAAHKEINIKRHKLGQPTIQQNQIESKRINDIHRRKNNELTSGDKRIRNDKILREKCEQTSGDKISIELKNINNHRIKAGELTTYEKMSNTKTDKHFNKVLSTCPEILSIIEEKDIDNNVIFTGTIYEYRKHQIDSARHFHRLISSAFNQTHIYRCKNKIIHILSFK